MTQKAFATLAAGDRVTLSGFPGVVESAGYNSIGRWFVSIGWDGVPVESLRKHSYISSEYVKDVRRLRRVK